MSSRASRSVCAAATARRRLAILITAVAVSLPGASQASQNTQSFDSDPADWVRINNPEGLIDFGFSNTNITGGASGAGEAGGSFHRVLSGPRHFYVDTTIGGVFSLSDGLAASGELDVTSLDSSFNSAILIGFLDRDDSTSSTGRFPDFVGIMVGENTTTSYRAWARVTQGNTILTSSPITLNADEDRVFSFAWDPAGGVNGGGLLEATLSGAGGGVLSLDLTPAQRASISGEEFDSFGLADAFGMSPPANTATGDLFIDGLTYGELPAVPALSPSGLAVLFLMLTLAGWGRLAAGRAPSPRLR